MYVKIYIFKTPSTTLRTTIKTVQWSMAWNLSTVFTGKSFSTCSPFTRSKTVGCFVVTMLLKFHSCGLCVWLFTISRLETYYLHFYIKVLPTRRTVINTLFAVEVFLFQQIWSISVLKSGSKLFNPLTGWRKYSYRYRAITSEIMLSCQCLKFFNGLYWNGVCKSLAIYISR